MQVKPLLHGCDERLRNHRVDDWVDLIPFSTFDTKSLRFEGGVKTLLALTVIVIDNLANLRREQENRCHIQPS